jgi:drug/metabolite transporter (DMT)-like permease
MSLRAWVAFVALSLLWGLPYLFIKLALEGFSPAWIAWGRVALAAAILLPIAWRRGVLRAAFAHKGAIAAFAALELAMPFYVIALGERWISSSLAGILIATVPLLVLLLSPLFGVKERLGARRLLGLAVGFAGVVALLGLDSVQGSWQWLGVGCVLLGAAGYAVGPLVVQRHLAGVDELGAVAASLLVATVVLLPAAIPTTPDELPSSTAVVALAVLGVVCTALALLVYFFLIGEAGAARAAVITYINPAVASLLGVLVLREHFGLGAMTGLALIVLGSWMGTGGRRRETA